MTNSEDARKHPFAIIPAAEGIEPQIYRFDKILKVVRHGRRLLKEAAAGGSA
jgi:hypothetical protein